MIEIANLFRAIGADVEEFAAALRRVDEDMAKHDADAMRVIGKAAKVVQEEAQGKCQLITQ